MSLEGNTVVANTPTDEEISGYALHLRFFIQDNEPISTREMDKMFKRLPIPPDLKSRFSSIRGQLNTWLDSRSSFGINSINLTNRKIFEVHLYGDLAHCTQAEELRAWQSYQLFYPMLRNHFIFLAGSYLNFLEPLGEICKKAETELQRSSP